MMPNVMLCWRMIADPRTNDYKRRQLRRQLDPRLAATGGKAFGRTDIRHPSSRPSHDNYIFNTSPENRRATVQPSPPKIDLIEKRIAHLRRPAEGVIRRRVDREAASR